MDKIINLINHALDFAQTELEQYSITGNNRHMAECKKWQGLASFYMNQLLMQDVCHLENIEFNSSIE